MSNRPKLVSLDAFAKTVEDARIRTASGGIITLICVVIVLLLMKNEYNDYTTIITRPELVVDRDINKQLDINLDISFPNLPCDILSLDLLDQTGDAQLDILKSGFQKYRLIKNTDGQVVEEILETNAVLLSNDVDIEEICKGLQPGQPGNCESCYGALPQENNRYCCNTCEAVKAAYAQKGWAFYDGENIVQCEREGYVAQLKSKINNREGCRVKGTTKINRVSGGLDFAPGTSFKQYNAHAHDLSLYTRHADQFNFNHKINHLSFGNVIDDLSPEATQPLNGHEVFWENNLRLSSYYLKVVATRFEFINEKSLPIESNQFSVITHDRPLVGGKDEDHQHTIHARGGVPGVIFHFDISPLKIINREQYAKPLSGFILGVISSIAGVLIVGSLIDRSVYAAGTALSGKKNI